MISVIIPIKNRAHVFTQALKAYLSQVLDHGLFEIIIVDQGSTDNLGVLTSRFRDPLQIRHFFNVRPECGHVEPAAFDGQVNPAFVQNFGVRQARGDIIVLTSPEVVMADDALSEISRFFHGHSNGYFLYGNVHNVDWVDTDDVYKRDELREMPVHAFPDIPHGVFCGPERTPDDNPFAYFIGAMKRDDFERLGGIDEIFMRGIAYEDAEFGRRARAAGLTLWLEEQVFGCHIHHGHARTMERAAGLMVNRGYFESLDPARTFANQAIPWGMYREDFQHVLPLCEE